MTAKEMFEELGYYDAPLYNCHWVKCKYIGEKLHIFFNSTEKMVDISPTSYNGNVHISTQLHQAIHQQLKELGWI